MPAEKPRVFCFINAGRGSDWVVSMAMAEDGTLLGQHVSSSDEWAKIDIGAGGKPPDPATAWPGGVKREAYGEHYPDGYEIEWVEHPLTHEGLREAYRRNQEAAKAAEEAEGAVQDRGQGEGDEGAGAGP